MIVLMFAATVAAADPPAVDVTFRADGMLYLIGTKYQHKKLVPYFLFRPDASYSSFDGEVMVKVDGKTFTLPAVDPSLNREFPDDLLTAMKAARNISVRFDGKAYAFKPAQVTKFRDFVRKYSK